MKSTLYVKVGILLMCVDIPSTSLQNIDFEGSNIAKGKETRQSPGTYENYNTYLKKSMPYKANLAVDGNTDKNFTHGSCSHTTNEKGHGASWTVDLGNSFHISGIHIFNRLSENRKRLRNFIIKGDHELLYDDTIKKQFSQSIISIPLDREKQQKYRSITISIPPRYDAFLTLCEVQIFGGCMVPSLKDGFYRIDRNTKVVAGSIVGFGKSIQLECPDGYTVQGNKILQCNLQSEEWGQTLPSCKVKNCGQLPLIQNGTYKYMSRTGGSSNEVQYRYGDVAIAICQPGYNLQGAGNRTCIDSNTWNGTAAVCIIEMCAYPASHQNGYYISSNGQNYTAGEFPFGTYINVKCNLGYKLTVDSAMLYCNESGQWAGNASTCEMVQCENPGTFENGIYNRLNEKSHYRFGTIITASCHKGYKLTSDSVTRSCNEKGHWTGKATPVCVSEEQIDAAVIGGAIFGCLVFLVVIVIGVIFKKRRDRDDSKRNTGLKNVRRDEHLESNAGLSEINEISDGDQATTTAHTVYQNAAFSGLGVNDAAEEYYNISTQSKMPGSAILIARLSDIVLDGNMDREMYAKQFESFSKNFPDKQAIGNKPENLKKNRYRNILPYDDTRVVLKKSSSGGDYINASYIHGFDKVNTYIATQGPLKETLQDFWRMIWQTDSGKIVMLTNLVEHQKVKCEQYWPEEGTSRFGDLQVRFERADEFAEFTIRTFSIKKENTKEKRVKQYHFTTWPDKGVPKYASSIVHFWSKIKHVTKRARGPIVVHCSAGVGRTGTFIALDYLVDQARALGYVDVSGCVETLRRQRTQLVQTLDQYIFIHRALVEALMLSTSAMSAADFPESFRKLLQTDPITRKRKLSFAFETLRKMSPVAEESQYVSAKQVRNRMKNRCSNILPVTEYMPALGSPTSSSNEEYINAVYLPTYKDQRAFIVTQMPLQQTIPDIWRLIYQHEIHSVVMLNHIDDAEESEIYWPEGGEIKEYTKFRIKNLGSEMFGDHRIVKLELTYLKKTRSIRHFQFGDWFPDATLPPDKDGILMMIELVQAWQRQSGNHTILVHCMNGAERSGLYCVISAVLERMKVEQDVAISHVIEEMRSRREQIIPTKEQFQFCHEAVLSFLEQHDMYSNFSA